MIFFENVQYLFLLLIIPLFIFFHIISIRGSKKRAIKFANFEAISQIKGVEIFSRNLTLLYLYIILAVLLIFTVSGMSYTKEVEVSNAGFVFAIDASGSMGARDIEPSRLEAAKNLGLDFLDIVPEKTSIGVISFSSRSFIHTEMTEDKIKISNSFKSITLQDYTGTDMLDAITTSIDILEGSNEGKIILISDGGLNINTIEQVIVYAKSNNVEIFALSVGNGEESADIGGAEFKNSQEALKLIAENTGGKYYLVEEPEKFYEAINNLLLVSKRSDAIDISMYLLFASISLLIILFILHNTRYRILP